MHLSAAVFCWGREGGRSPQQDKPAGTAGQLFRPHKLCLYTNLVQEPQPNLTHGKRVLLALLLSATQRLGTVIQEHHSICLFPQSPSLKCLTITWKLIFHLKQPSGASMETQTRESYMHTRNQTGPKISKSLTATAFHLPASQHLSLATLHKSSRHRTHPFFFPGLGLLSGSLWGVRKEGVFWLICWEVIPAAQQSSHSSTVEALLSPSAGFIPQMFRLKAKSLQLLKNR